MGDNADWDDPTPEDYTEKALNDIAALGDYIKESNRAVMIVGALIAVSGALYIFATLQGWHSAFVLPVMSGLVLGNHLYMRRIRSKEKKLQEMLDTHESKGRK